jgi:hypothetical protein
MFGCSLWKWLEEREAACRGEWSLVARKLVSKRRPHRPSSLTGARTAAATNDGRTSALRST